MCVSISFLVRGTKDFSYPLMLEASAFWALTFSFGKLSCTFLRLPATSSQRLCQGLGVSTKSPYTGSVEKWMVLASTAHGPFKESLVSLWALGRSLPETLCGQSLNFCLPSDVTGSRVHVSSVCRTMWLFFPANSLPARKICFNDGYPSYFMAYYY